MRTIQLDERSISCHSRMTSIQQICQMSILIICLLTIGTQEAWSVELRKNGQVGDLGVEGAVGSPKTDVRDCAVIPTMDEGAGRACEGSDGLLSTRAGNKPIGYWTFRKNNNEIVFDYSGNGFDGMILPKVSDIIVNDGDTAAKAFFHANGKDSRMAIPCTDLLNNGDARTIEVLFRPESFPLSSGSARVGLVAYDDQSFRLWLKANGSVQLESKVNGKFEYSPSAPVRLGEWNHVFAYYGNRRTGVYVNGIDYSKEIETFPLNGKACEISIAAHPAVEDRWLHGDVGMVRIYGKALATCDMKELFEGKLEYLNPRIALPHGICLPGEKFALDAEFSLPRGTIVKRALIDLKGNLLNVASIDLERLKSDSISTGSLPDGDYVISWEFPTKNGLKRVARPFRMDSKSFCELDTCLSSIEKSQMISKPLAMECRKLLSQRDYSRLKGILNLIEKRRDWYSNAADTDKFCKDAFSEELLRGKPDRIPPIFFDIPSAISPERFNLIHNTAKSLYGRMLCFYDMQDKGGFKFDLFEKVNRDGMDSAYLMEPAMPKPFLKEWNDKHPEQLCAGYWWMQGQAAGKGLSLRLWRPDSLYAPMKYWVVWDETGKRRLASDEWRYDDFAQAVEVKSEPGHIYKVFYVTIIKTVGAGAEGYSFEPLYEDQRAAAALSFEQWINQLKGRIKILYTDGGYPYPGSVPQGFWEWDSYCFGAASPYGQKLFEAKAGVKFDPVRLFQTEAKNIDSVPSPDYLKWMEFKQGIVNDYFKRITVAAHKANVKVQWYWGDAHIGMEPYLGGLEQAGMDSLSKPMHSSGDVRTTMDIPGDCMKGGRIQWLFPETIRDPKCPEKLWDRWTEVKRGMLFNSPDFMYWMMFKNVFSCRDGAEREMVVDVLRLINQEFLLMYKYIHGKKSYRHNINVYVVNSWGRIYSWQPFGDRFLRHLTDIPVNIKFISLKDISENGIPNDANVIINYGAANSSWSGGANWNLSGVQEKVVEFVKKGGGFVGVGMPAYCKSPGGVCSLKDVMGFEYAPGQSGAIQLKATQYGAAHWITNGTVRISMAESTQAEDMEADAPVKVKYGDLNSTENIAPTSNELRLLMSSDGKSPLRPLLAINKCGAGRSVYISYTEDSGDYSNLIRKCIFWAAAKECDFERISCETAGVYLYLYASERILIVHNQNDFPVVARINFDPSLVEGMGDGSVKLTEMVGGMEITETDAGKSRRGRSVPMKPQSTAFIKLERKAPSLEK